MITKMKGRTVGRMGGIGFWVRRQKRKGWEVRVLNGWEAGEIEVNIIFAIKKRSKGRKPR